MAKFGCLRANFGCSGANLGHLGTILGYQRANLGYSRANLGFTGSTKLDFTTKVLCLLSLKSSKETPHLQVDITRSFFNRFLKVGGVLKRKRQALSVKVGPEGLALFV